MPVNLLRGAARALDLVEMFGLGPRAEAILSRSDDEALRADMRAVGDDMRAAMHAVGVDHGLTGVPDAWCGEFDPDNWRRRWPS